MKNVNIFWVIISSAAIISCGPAKHQARIILVPDTQYYAEKYPEILDSQVNWIVRESNQVAFVLQQGDITQNNSDVEWQRAKQSFSKLDNVVPYVLAAGNHDMGSGPGKFADVRNTNLFNQYFPFSHMSKLSAFGGSFEPGKMENAYYLLQTGKVKWLVITLEFGPRDNVLEWAGKIAAQYPDRSVIINTHCYLYSDSTRVDAGDDWPPQNYGIGKNAGEGVVNDGEQMWTKLVKNHPNIRWVFSGHILHSGVGTLVSINDEGYPVYQMLANYQEGVTGSVKGGNGWLRILDMDFKKKTIKITTYSPYINEYMSNPAHNFIIRNVFFTPGNKTP